MEQFGNVTIHALLIYSVGKYYHARQHQNGDQNQAVFRSIEKITIIYFNKIMDRFVKLEAMPLYRECL